MKAQLSPRDLALTLAVVALWGHTFVPMKVALDEVPPFALLIPVSGLASGALFLGESLAPVQIGGVALVFAGLVVNVYGLKMRAWLARRL